MSELPQVANYKATPYSELVAGTPVTFCRTGFAPDDFRQSKAARPALATPTAPDLKQVSYHHAQGYR
jgi:hypothetical protein